MLLCSACENSWTNSIFDYSLEITRFRLQRNTHTHHGHIYAHASWATHKCHGMNQMLCITASRNAASLVCARMILFAGQSPAAYHINVHPRNNPGRCERGSWRTSLVILHCLTSLHVHFLIQCHASLLCINSLFWQAVWYKGHDPRLQENCFFFCAQLL